MKPAKPDNRFASQLIALGLLVALPITMIVLNGVGALNMLVFGKATSTSSAALSASPESKPVPKRKVPLLFGVYDPKGEFANDGSLEIRHEYVSWLDFREDQLLPRLQANVSRGMQTLLTVEPWARAGRKETLLLDITEGRYNEEISRLVKLVNNLTGPVYLSWGHEMDQNISERYPWSAREPQQYIRAYRYVVNRLREQVSTKVLLVWSGVLKTGSLKYWPGKGYADFIGMSLYSFPEWDRRNHGHIRDFRKIFETKFAVVESLSTPVLITEMGVAGSPDFESFWLQHAFDCFGDFPQLSGVIFFYAKDADGVWGKDIRTPDWRVHPDSIRGLVKWHKSQFNKSRSP